MDTGKEDISGRHVPFPGVSFDGKEPAAAIAPHYLRSLATNSRGCCTRVPSPASPGP